MKTVILCGGYGTRLSEETIIKPKPMVEIGGYPILWHIMKRYHKFKINNFIIALGYKGDYIKNYFSNYQIKTNNLSIDFESSELKYLTNNSEKWKVDLIDTGLNTMTGGRLLRLKPELENEEIFMLTYGDGVSNVNINKLIQFHKSHGKIGTMTVVRPPVRFGEVFLEQNGLVKKFQEKPQTQSGWINGGFFVFNPKIFDYIENDTIMLERAPLEKLVLDNELMAFEHNDFWQCMDTVRDRDYLNNIWESGNVPWI
jgi:glucose-1-phosphate cytidylyltransferase